MDLSARLRHVPDPADYGLFSALTARCRYAAPVIGSESRNWTIGSSTGQQKGVEIRLYHGGMTPRTSTLACPPIPTASPDSATTEPTAVTAATTLEAPFTTGTPLGGAVSAPAAADSERPAPSDPQQPPDLGRLGNCIAELSSRIQAATYELLCYLREFDRHYGWEGFRSCAHWLNWRTGLDLGAAREKLRVAAALADLNHLSAAMACGRLSYSVVRGLTRVATPDNEAHLVAIACCATGAQVERLVRAWRQADREALPDAEKARLARRALSTRVDEDGMVVLRARLTPEVGAVVLRALEAALEQVPAGAEGEEAGIAQRRADALGLVAESALAGGLDPGRPGDRFQVTVHVEAETLRSSEPINATADTSAETQAAREAAPGPAAPADAVAGQTHVETVDAHHHAAAGSGLDAGQAVIEQAGGIHLGKHAARRIGCDSGGLVLIHAPDGGVLDVGRRTRTVPTAMRRALEGRDRNGCQFPGCNSRHCDAHHVVHWADGGATELSNLPRVPIPSPRAARGGLSGSRRWRRGVPVPAPGWRAVAGGAAGATVEGWRGPAGADRGAAGGGRHWHRAAHRYPRVVRRVAERDGGARRAVGTSGWGAAGYRDPRRRSLSHRRRDAHGADLPSRVTEPLLAAASLLWKLGACAAVPGLGGSAAGGARAHTGQRVRTRNRLRAEPRSYRSSASSARAVHRSGARL